MPKRPPGGEADGETEAWRVVACPPGRAGALKVRWGSGDWWLIWG